jgi:Tfp pilus assembly protein PilN
MPFINLIQEHVLAGKRERKRAQMALTCFVVATCLAVGANGYCLYQGESLESQIAVLKQENEKHKGMLAQIEQNRLELLDLAPRLKTLSNAQVMTQRWSTILDHLSKQTPPGAWLTSVRSQGSDPSKPLQTSFQGLSSRQELVGEFILRLQACKELENVNLKFTAEKIVNTGKGIEFDVSAEVAGTAEAKPKDELKENSN